MTDCVPATGRVSPKGYVQAYDPIRKRMGWAHRVAWGAANGQIPEGMTVGHLCHDSALATGSCDGGNGCPHRSCVNLEHLALQTMRENHRTAYRDGVCNNGHVLDEVGGLTSNRLCKRCQREWKRQWRASRRERGLVAS